MADTNWIKLNRKIWRCPIWSFEKPQYALAWIDMLLMANYKDKKILFDGAFETVERGSFITSMVKLAERWNMDRRTVKRLLDILQQDGMISYECTPKRTAIRIIKYDLYQGIADFSVPVEPENDVPDSVGDGAVKVSGECPAGCTTKCTTECTGKTIENTGVSGSDTPAECTTECTTQCTTECTTERTTECTTDCTQHKKVKNLKESKEGKESFIGDSSDGKRPASPPIPYEEIRALYNQICTSLPRCMVMSEARKKAIRARMSSGYTLEKIKTVFQKAEASSFLKGKNDRNWKANFDWLFVDSKMARVLEGYYDDVKGGNGNGPNSGNYEPIQQYGLHV